MAKVYSFSVPDNDVFDDIQDYANFEARCRRTGREPKDAIKARLSAWASEKQISYPEAVKLFCKAFPELKVFEEVVVR